MPSPARAAAVAALLTFASMRAAMAAPVAPPVNVQYVIDAALDPASYRLIGRTEITWLRRAHPVREVRLQLFLNAWRNAQSTWMREHSGEATWSMSRWGGIEVTAMSADAGGRSYDLLPAAHFIAPDDGNADDRTLLEAALPATIGEADVLVIRLQWTATVPSSTGETGARGREFFLAQWTPQICDVDSSGWQCRQAHRSMLTPAEAADYEVRLGMPSGFTARSTGRVTGRTDGDGRRTDTFTAHAVRAFAWTASPDFVEVTARVPMDAPVDVTLLMQPEHRSQASRYLEAIEASLIEYRAVAPYPFDHLTIVDRAWGTAATGHAYPAVVTVTGRWLTSTAMTEVEADIARGIARQWWGHLVAIDPGRDSITAGAIADYVHVRVVDALLNRHRGANGYAFYTQRYFGGFVPWVFPRMVLNGAADAFDVPAYRALPTADAPSTTRPLGSAALAAVRAKAAMAFATLERYTGWAAMQRALSALAEREAFQTVPRDAAFATISAAQGHDLSWFFAETFDRSATFDYAVTELTTRAEAAGSCAAAPCFRTAVVVRRLGDAEFTGTAQGPVGSFQAGRALTVLVRFADGSEATEHWDGRARWRLFEYESRAAAVSAQIDPDRVLLLDLQTVNNSLTRQPQGARAATRWTGRWMIWLQDCLLTYASLI